MLLFAVFFVFGLKAEGLPISDTPIWPFFGGLPHGMLSLLPVASLSHHAMHAIYVLHEMMFHLAIYQDLAVCLYCL